MTATYGSQHQEKRSTVKRQIDREGGVCAERVCIKPTRRIERGAFFHLAHDHLAGGGRRYLGPAHPECNLHERARRKATTTKGRGMVWWVLLAEFLIIVYFLIVAAGMGS